VPLMNLLYRLLAPGGFLLTQTPAVADLEGKVGLGAFQDPTHVSYWSRNNTWYFTKKQYAQYVPEIVCRFQSIRVATGYISDWHKENGIPYLLWDAMAIKDGPYLPGPKEI